MTERCQMSIDHWQSDPQNLAMSLGHLENRAYREKANPNNIIVPDRSNNDS